MVTLLRMHIRGHDEQAVDARVNIPSHGQCTKDFFPDVIRGWLVLQRSGLSESSKKTVRTRWARRDRKIRACVQGETHEWEQEVI